MLRLTSIALFTVAIAPAALAAPRITSTLPAESPCAAIKKPTERFVYFSLTTEANKEPDLEALRKRANDKPELLNPTEQHNVAIALLAGPDALTLGVQRKACDLLERAAQGGVAASNTMIGELLNAFSGSPEMARLAGLYYQRALQGADPLARLRLAQMLAYGLNGVPADPKAAALVVEELAQNGFSHAKMVRALFHLHGVGGPQDGVQARAWLEELAGEGYYEAEEELGYLYLYGATGVAVDFEAALKWYSRAFEHGRAGGALGAGRTLYSARNPKFDETAALAWFEKAAAAGHPSGKAEVANILATDSPSITGDPPRACRLAQEAADAGNLTGAFVLSRLLEAGAGCPKDEEKSIYWLKRAVELGQVQAKERLGVRLAYGRGLEKDLPRGKALIEEAGRSGRPSAYCTRGRVELDVGGEGAAESAYQWYERGSEHGVSECKLAMAGLLIDGKLPPKYDRLRAVALLNEIADYDMGAAAMLGKLYADGAILAKDDARALPLLRRAAEAGFAQAQYYLGVFHHFGRGGLPVDYSAAAAEYEKASADIPEALTNLAHLLMNGLGVPQDQKKALDLLEHAAAKNDSTALAQLSTLYSRGLHGIPADQAKAATYAQKAADLGMAWGQAQSGINYLHGWGVPKDNARAFHYFRLGAAQNEPSSLNSLGFAHLHGLEGQTKDETLALRYLDAAARLGQPNALMTLAAVYAGQTLGQPDLAKSLAYITLAIAQKDVGLDEARVTQARRMRDALRQRLAPEQVEHADKLATEMAQGFAASR